MKKISLKAGYVDGNIKILHLSVSPFGWTFAFFLPDCTFNFHFEVILFNLALLNMTLKKDYI